MASVSVSEGWNGHGTRTAPTRSEVRGAPGLLPAHAQETRRLPLRTRAARPHRGGRARRGFRGADRDRRLQARARAGAPQTGCDSGLALGSAGGRRPASGAIVPARSRGDRFGAGVAPRGDPKAVRILPRGTGPSLRPDGQLGQPQTRLGGGVAPERPGGDPRRSDRPSRGEQVSGPLGARQPGALRELGARHLAGGAHEPGSGGSVFRLAGRILRHPRPHRLRTALVPQGSAGASRGSRRRRESRAGGAAGRRHACGHQPPDSPPDSGGRRRPPGPLGDGRSPERAFLGACPDRHDSSGIPGRRSRCSTRVCARRS